MIALSIGAFGCNRSDEETEAVAVTSLSTPSVDVPFSFTSCKEVLAWRSSHPSLFRSVVVLDKWTLEVDNRTRYCQACGEKPNTLLSSPEFKQRVETIGQSTQVILRARPKNKVEPLEASTLEKSAVTVNNGDTLPCSFAHRENNPEVVPYYTYILGFDMNHPLADPHLVFPDQLFGGIAKFQINHPGLESYTEAVERGLQN